MNTKPEDALLNAGYSTEAVTDILTCPGHAGFEIHTAKPAPKAKAKAKAKATTRSIGLPAPKQFVAMDFYAPVVPLLRYDAFESAERIARQNCKAGRTGTDIVAVYVLGRHATRKLLGTARVDALGRLWTDLTSAGSLLA